MSIDQRKAKIRQLKAQIKDFKFLLFTEERHLKYLLLDAKFEDIPKFERRIQKLNDKIENYFFGYDDKYVKTIKEEIGVLMYAIEQLRL